VLLQDARYGGYEDVHSNKDLDVGIYEGRMYIALPPTCTLMFRHKSL
jgi:hypothetical protein